MIQKGRSKGPPHNTMAPAPQSHNDGAAMMPGAAMPSDIFAEGGPVVPVFLTPATSSIVPVSSKTGKNKEIALQFIQSPKDVQALMLKDPTISKAILQTLSESP